MDEINRTDELKHWGVLGMRWGVRKSKKQLAKEANKKKADLESEDFKTSKKKSLSKMSDDEITKELNRRRLELEYKKQKDLELKQEVDRLDLEAKYAALNPPKVSLGKKIIDSVWPTVEKATLEAGGTLLKEGLLKVGRDALGLNVSDDSFDFDKESKKLDYYGKYKKQYGVDHPDVAAEKVAYNNDGAKTNTSSSSGSNVNNNAADAASKAAKKPYVKPTVDTVDLSNANINGSSKKKYVKPDFSEYYDAPQTKYEVQPSSKVYKDISAYGNIREVTGEKNALTVKRGERFLLPFFRNKK